MTIAPNEIMTMTKCTQIKHISKESKCVPQILKNKFSTKKCARDISEQNGNFLKI